MLKEKAGNVAGQIWTALNGTDGLTHQQIKKATDRQGLLPGIGLVVKRRQGFYF